MKISVFGAGLMGIPIAQKLQQSGYKVTAYNRTASKLEVLENSDICATTAIKKAIAASNFLLLTLSDAKAIKSVLFADDYDFTDKMIIQMGTIAPEESRDISAKIMEQGGSYIEAPVLGSIPQAKTGTLLVMAGGTPETFEQCFPILAKLGQEPRLIGEIGTAAALKLALNQLIAALTAGFSLSLGLIQKEGVDLEKFMTILRESALYAPTFDKKLQRMGDRHFDHPNFPTKHLLKDTDLFLKAAETANLNSGGLVGIREIIAQAVAENLADQDYSAIYNVINPE